MRSFPDQPAEGFWAELVVFAIPLAYLVSTILYSAHMAPWGRNVDPESAYAMNGLIAAAGYPFMKYDHPGTTTTLLVRVVIGLLALLKRPEDIVEFGLRNYDAVIYAARLAQALMLAGALVAGGVIVRHATDSAIAAVLFQIPPFANGDTFHYEMILIPESLMMSFAVVTVALAVKAALDAKPPSIALGITSGLVFALGLSSKYLYMPLACLATCLSRNRRALVATLVSGTAAFVAFNLILNPDVFRRGIGWLFSLAIHTDAYGRGEIGFIDFRVFWSNMAQIIAAAPFACGLLTLGATVALVQMRKSRTYSDPIGLTMIAAFCAFLVQLVLTSKHFGDHYMMASWAMTGGVLVLTIIEMRRLFPGLPPQLPAAVGLTVCALVIATTLSQIRHNAAIEEALEESGARLSRTVNDIAPACANVSSMFVHAPENEPNHGWTMTMGLWGTQPMKDRFSDAYAHGFKTPLLDYNNYTRILMENFKTTSYARLAKDYGCIVVRSSAVLDAENAIDLLDLHPDHCTIQGIQVYSVGVPCKPIESAFEAGKSVPPTPLVASFFDRLQ